MNPRLLQLGAEVLGWEMSHDGMADDLVYVSAPNHVAGFVPMELVHPALPAYMAEALATELVGRGMEVRRTYRPGCNEYAVISWPRRLKPEVSLVAKPGCGCFIAAALVARERITLEEAQEMVQ